MPRIVASGNMASIVYQVIFFIGLSLVLLELTSANGEKCDLVEWYKVTEEKGVFNIGLDEMTAKQKQIYLGVKKVYEKKIKNNEAMMVGCKMLEQYDEEFKVNEPNVSETQPEEVRDNENQAQGEEVADQKGENDPVADQAQDENPPVVEENQEAKPEGDSDSGQDGSEIEEPKAEALVEGTDEQTQDAENEQNEQKDEIVQEQAQEQVDSGSQHGNDEAEKDNDENVAQDKTEESGEEKPVAEPVDETESESGEQEKVEEAEDHQGSEEMDGSDQEETQPEVAGEDDDLAFLQGLADDEQEATASSEEVIEGGQAAGEPTATDSADSVADDPTELAQAEDFDPTEVDETEGGESDDEDMAFLEGLATQDEEEKEIETSEGSAEEVKKEEEQNVLDAVIPEGGVNGSGSESTEKQEQLPPTIAPTPAFLDMDHIATLSIDNLSDIRHWMYSTFLFKSFSPNVLVKDDKDVKKVDNQESVLGGLMDTISSFVSGDSEKVEKPKGDNESQDSQVPAPETQEPVQKDTTETKYDDVNQNKESADNVQDILRQQGSNSKNGDPLKKDIDMDKLEELIETKRKESATKIQQIEMQLLKLENQMLMETINKNNGTSALTKLENHILKLENELLRVNQSFVILQAENDLLKKAQLLQQTELAEVKENESKYPMLTDNSTAVSDDISKQQMKIKELSDLINNQSLGLQTLQTRSHTLEEQNKMLVETLMNQTLFMNELMARLNNVSEQQIQQKKQLEEALKSKSVPEKATPHPPRINDGVESKQAEPIKETSFNVEKDEKEDEKEEDEQKEVNEGKEETKEESKEETKEESKEESKEETKEESKEETKEESKEETKDAGEDVDDEDFLSSLLDLGDEEDSKAEEVKSDEKADADKDAGVKKDVKEKEPVKDTKEAPTKEAKEEKAHVKKVSDKEASKEKKPMEKPKTEEKKAPAKDEKKSSEQVKKQETKKTTSEAAKKEVKAEKKETAKESSTNKTVKQAAAKDTKAEAKPKEKQAEKKVEATKQEVKVTKTEKKAEAKPAKDAKKADPVKKEAETPKKEPVKKPATEVKKEAEKKPDGKSKEAVKDVKKETASAGKPVEKEVKKMSGDKASSGPPELRYHDPKYKGYKDCYDYYLKGRKRDTSLKIKPVNSKNEVTVFCDMKNGGWTLIQKRQDGTVDFFRDWADYKQGFGVVYGEHWLGLDNIHMLTYQEYYTLRIDMQNWDRQTVTVEYDLFMVEDEDEGYKLTVSGYRGDVGDALLKHSGYKFSTKDVDNDEAVKDFGGSCAKRFNGAWWYYKCYKSNLNGKYYKGGKVADKLFDGVAWKPWTGSVNSLKKVEMKIRPKIASDK